MRGDGGRPRLSASRGRAHRAARADVLRGRRDADGGAADSRGRRGRDAHRAGRELGGRSGRVGCGPSGTGGRIRRASGPHGGVLEGRGREATAPQGRWAWTPVAVDGEDVGAARDRLRDEMQEVGAKFGGRRKRGRIRWPPPVRPAKRERGWLRDRLRQDAPPANPRRGAVASGPEAADGPANQPVRDAGGDVRLLRSRGDARPLGTRMGGDRPARNPSRRRAGSGSCVAGPSGSMAAPVRDPVAPQRPSSRQPDAGRRLRAALAALAGKLATGRAGSPRVGHGTQPERTRALSAEGGDCPDGRAPLTMVH